VSGPTHESTYAELADVLESLSHAVAITRRARGVSLRQCAQETGVSFTTVRRFENGEAIAMDSVVALMRWIDQTRTVKS